MPGFDTVMNCDAGSPSISSFGPFNATFSIGSSTLNDAEAAPVNRT